MNAWAQRHRAALEAALEDGETLRAADRVITTGRRRRPANMPRTGFVLVVTDRRLIALAASRWMARPRHLLESWRYEDGYKLAAGARWTFGRVHLVLPDRNVITLRPFGGRRLNHLADEG